MNHHIVYDMNAFLLKQIFFHFFSVLILNNRRYITKIILCLPFTDGIDKNKIIHKCILRFRITIFK